MATYNDEAIVLRTHRLGEADRIVTVISRAHGKLRGVAKGVRRTSSKLGARLEPFALVDLQIIEGRSLDIFTQVVSRQLYGKAMLDDYARYTAAEVMVEMVDKLVPEERIPALQQYHLLAGGLHTLVTGTTDGPRPSTMILTSYLLRSAAIAGYAMAIADCAACGARGPHPWFHAAAGGLVCANCKPLGSAAVAGATAHYLIALLTGDWPATAEVPANRVAEAAGLVRAFLTWHLDRGLSSLRHLE
ncbi:MAG: DNA repair protein RecO [Propionibacteriaceae bacterium]|jgi:DNA repair protein RecO (recombination protein O)|nr:DNA repair protein RecO [Propionibacteriaceae bacterium]